MQTNVKCEGMRQINEVENYYQSVYCSKKKNKKKFKNSTDAIMNIHENVFVALKKFLV